MTVVATLPERVSILGLPLDCIDMPSTLDRIESWIGAPRPPHGASPELARSEPTRHVVTLNPEMVMAARENSGFRAVIAQADLVVADGAGILVAARRQGVRLPERVTGVDLLQLLAGRAAEKSYRIFLLGAQPGVAEETAAHLTQRYPQLIIAGTYPGSPREADDAEITSRVRATEADIVFVAFGAPAQELWIARNRAALGACVAIGVGGAFDFVAGRTIRAPLWMRQRGLEWLFRLWKEPWRWKRMLALPRFLLAAVMSGRSTAEIQRVDSPVPETAAIGSNSAGDGDTMSLAQRVR